MIMSDVIDLLYLQQWVGKTETTCDLIAEAAAGALAAMLDRSTIPPTLPPLWHWIYFNSAAPQSHIGSDGHPQRGRFLPPVPLPRRMWAAGRLKFGPAIPFGTAAKRISRIDSVVEKQGASGNFAFVTVEHQIMHQGQVSISEQHDIVYRDLPEPGAKALTGKPAPADTPWSRTVNPDPVLLFRYSALTFNGHRIHYDRSYATGTEGYPGLVVHGPLIATLLVDLLQHHLPEAHMVEFNFRALRPLFDTEPFTLCAQPDANNRTVQLWARNMHGELAMQARATLADSQPKERQ